MLEVIYASLAILTGRAFNVLEFSLEEMDNGYRPLRRDVV